MSEPPEPEQDKPAPRPPRSPESAAQVRVRNRRRESLARNPGYLDELEHEFADPLLYASLIKQFQTPAERQADGRAKGYSRVLEGDLLRGEARLQQLADDAGRQSSGVSGAVPAANPESAWRVAD